MESSFRRFFKAVSQCFKTDDTKTSDEEQDNHGKVCQNNGKKETGERNSRGDKMCQERQEGQPSAGIKRVWDRAGGCRFSADLSACGSRLLKVVKNTKIQSEEIEEEVVHGTERRNTNVSIEEDIDQCFIPETPQPTLWCRCIFTLLDHHTRDIPVDMREEDPSTNGFVRVSVGTIRFFMIQGENAVDMNEAEWAGHEYA